jgi:hypothetical protein
MFVHDVIKVCASAELNRVSVQTELKKAEASVVVTTPR